MEDDRLDVASDFWANLLRHQPLGILTDVDGTLLPFENRADEVVTPPELRSLMDELASSPGVTLAVVSGRPKEELDRLFPEPRRALLIAEHGAWRSGPEGWQPTLQLDPGSIDSLVVELERLGDEYPRARIERKTWSAAIHFRLLEAHEKADLLGRVGGVLDPWLADHPHFERLWGSEVLEVRPRGATKATAVSWIREMLGPEGRLLVAGDDFTDEDMFAAASDSDATILVHHGQDRPTAARWKLSGIEEMRGLLGSVLSLRRDATLTPGVRPLRVSLEERPAPSTSSAFLIVSNRLPDLSPDEAGERTKSVGGLVSALLPVLSRSGGVWLGWSGKTRNVHTPDPQLVEHPMFSLAAIDLPEEWYRHYYVGFANSALWPVLHSFPARLRISHDDFRAYALANDAFARAACQLVGPDAAVWVHDYHLLLLAHDLRRRGHRGRIGHFLHVPFPGPDVFFLLPWANEILDAMLAFDLLGFHTRTYAENFLHCVAHRPAVSVDGFRAVRGSLVTRVEVFPLGISPGDLQASSLTEDAEIATIKRALGDVALVLGVDRLDYTKGIPERIEAFGRLLELHPEWRRKVCLVQVSVPSREEIDEYSDQRSRIENSVGRINGLFGEADWVPIRYLYRSYQKAELAQLYRAADVGYVTPLRDGMNLVAKEFVAAQDDADPGILVLSRFAGAAEELTEAVLTNPWDVEGTVSDLDRALRMPLDERQRRHRASFAVVSERTALHWAEDFTAALLGTDASPEFEGERSSGLWVMPSTAAFSRE